MKHQVFDASSARVSDRIPASCGEVTVGCSDVAGIIEGVKLSSRRLRAEHSALQETISELEADQRRVGQASGEARLLSERAMERLGEGTELIQSSLGQITELLDLVDTLSNHVTGFAAAMNQVRRSAQDIERIAETTNILALNATIEAHRAGDAGRTFAVVANEVKNLAGSTRLATDEISRTIDMLGGEAEQVVAKIENGAAASGEAKASVARIERTLSNVAELVEEVDRQNDRITNTTGAIGGLVDRARQVLTNFDVVAVQSEQKLDTAHDRIEALEMTASDMFDSIVKTGLSPIDSAMVERARHFAAELVTVTEAALETGALSIEALFDTDYREIAGTNPPRFRTCLTDWADSNWRPIFDRVLAQGGALKMCSPSDMNGFMPTHATDRSRPPTGDIAHDTKYCRNGRIVLTPADQKAKRSSDPYTLAVYRQEGDGQHYEVIRNIYVPLVIGGQRWGDFELAYTL